MQRMEAEGLGRLSLEGGVGMANDARFRTGQRVKEPGTYECEAGSKRELRELDEFPICPESGRETTWRKVK